MIKDELLLGVFKELTTYMFGTSGNAVTSITDRPTTMVYDEPAATTEFSAAPGSSVQETTQTEFSSSQASENLNAEFVL